MPHQAGPYQELSEGYNAAVPVSSAEWTGSHTQSQHLGEEGCQKGLPLDWTTVPQDPRTGTLSPEPKEKNIREFKKNQDNYVDERHAKSVASKSELESMHCP